MEVKLLPFDLSFKKYRKAYDVLRDMRLRCNEYILGVMVKNNLYLARFIDLPHTFNIQTTLSCTQNVIAACAAKALNFIVDGIAPPNTYSKWLCRKINGRVETWINTALPSDSDNLHPVMRWLLCTALYFKATTIALDMEPARIFQTIEDALDTLYEYIEIFVDLDQVYDFYRYFPRHTRLVMYTFYRIVDEWGNDKKLAALYTLLENNKAFGVEIYKGLLRDISKPHAHSNVFGLLACEKYQLPHPFHYVEPIDARHLPSILNDTWCSVYKQQVEPCSVALFNVLLFRLEMNVGTYKLIPDETMNILLTGLQAPDEATLLEWKRRMSRFGFTLQTVHNASPLELSEVLVIAS